MKRFVYLTLFMLMFTKPFIASAVVKPPSNPNSAKGCAICHYRWIDTFFIDGKGTDLVEYNSEKVEATPEMCLSCHDGSVKDSRERIKDSSSGHKVNVKPPAGMKIPGIFPLDEQGKVQCATCHTAHGVPSGPNVDNTIFMRTSNKDSAMCRMCHTEMDGGLKKGNHPVGQTKNEIPETITTHWASTKKNTIICETCHTAHGSRFENFLRINDRDSGLCLACHTDKDSLTPKGKKNPTHIVNIVPRSAIIPEELMDKGAKLGKNKEIICQTCHKVHKNQLEQNLLIIENDQKATLCLTCHLDKKGLFETKHNLMRSAPKEQNLYGTTAANAGICSPCHEVHKPARKLPGTGDYTTELCLSCHRKGNMTKKITYTGMAHPINVKRSENKIPETMAKTPPSAKETLSLPLYDKNGGPNTKGEVTCATCHDPHNRHIDTAANTTKKTSKTDDAFVGSFLRIPPDRICRECHANQYGIVNSKHDLNKSAPESENILKQKPSVSGICGSCHLIHKEGAAFPWARDPLGPKDPCMSCHDKDGISQKKLTSGYSHPMDIAPLKKKMTTSLPLYAKNGKRSNSGTMKCGTCHNPHAWDPSNGFNAQYSDIEGNAQNSFLRLQNSPTPALCGDCHTDKTIIKNSDHNLLLTSPKALNSIGQTPLESGICGVCHIAHNSKHETLLWARELEYGNSIMEKMCNDCHSKKGSAKSKIPAIASHPEDIFIMNAHEKAGKNSKQFLLFDEASGRQVHVGKFACPSCHNAHQWNPNSSAKDIGYEPEGNVTNSFIKTKVEYLPCKDCHGPDALLKFLYFHEPNKRTQQFLFTKD
ncbi:MAG: hypothetical protein C0403_01150 [Desulfobacterium sp.]|nr:hypothetical protein [Desulfobacterium sp.]